MQDDDAGGGSAAQFRFDPVVVGTLCGLLASLGYTAANICLRGVTDVDPTWVAAVKSMPTILMTTPWLVMLWWRRTRAWPGRQSLLLLTAAAVFGQLGGNVGFQWSLGVIGIAMAVPITTGAMILAGGWLGQVFLGESLSRRSMAANLLLILAVCILSLGAEDALSAVRSRAGQSDARLLALLGVAASCLAGVAYTVQGVVIRRTVTRETHVAAALFVVSTVGLAVAGVLVWSQLGWEAISRTPIRSLQTMFAAGVFNAASFLALSLALKWTRISHVNALSATQVAMASIAGVSLFGEPLSSTLLWGVGLTVVGLLLMRPASRPARATEGVGPASGPR